MTLEELRNSDRAVVTVTEAAALLEVDERTVRRACEAGQLPHLRIGVRVLLPREQFLSLLAPAPADAGTPGLPHPV